jgi:type II secretory pathway pseudopilin PulG
MLGNHRDVRTRVRKLLAIGIIGVMAAVIAPAARASSLTGAAQAQVNSAEQLAQQMTANAQQTVKSEVSVAQNAASNAVAGARQTIETALNRTATLTPTTPSQTGTGSQSGSSSSSGTSSPPPTQSASLGGAPSPEAPSGSTPGAAAQGLAATVAGQARVFASIPQPAWNHLKAFTGLALQRATRPGAAQPWRPQSGLRSGIGPPPTWPRERPVPRPVTAEHPGASLGTPSLGLGLVHEPPTAGRPSGHALGSNERPQARRSREPSTPLYDDSTASSVTLVASAPISAAPPAGGAAGAGFGGGGGAPAAALLALFALSLLIAPSGRRMSLELPPWRSVTCTSPLERPG